jgi:hypothetical protein
VSLVKKSVDLPTFEVHPNGRLIGHTLVMRAPAIDLYLRIRSGKNVAGTDLAVAVVDATVDDSFDLPGGIRGLDLATVLDLVDPWISAWEESILPPASGRPSSRPSDGSPSTRTRGRRSRSVSPSGG